MHGSSNEKQEKEAGTHINVQKLWRAKREMTASPIDEQVDKKVKTSKAMEQGERTAYNGRQPEGTEKACRPSHLMSGWRRP